MESIEFQLLILVILHSRVQAALLDGPFPALAPGFDISETRCNYAITVSMITQITPHYARAQFCSDYFKFSILKNFEKEKSIEAVSIMYHVTRESEFDVFVHKQNFPDIKAKGIKIQNHGGAIIPQ